MVTLFSTVINGEERDLNFILIFKIKIIDLIIIKLKQSSHYDIFYLKSNYYLSDSYLID